MRNGNEEIGNKKKRISTFLRNVALCLDNLKMALRELALIMTLWISLQFLTLILSVTDADTDTEREALFDSTVTKRGPLFVMVIPEMCWFS